MSNFIHKPELALRRALELKDISQEQAALTLLHEVLSSRRHRTWSPAYEQIMMTYLDLCLALNQSRQAKDGLHQYRNLSQSQAPGSLEKVIRYLMDQAERKCQQAQKFASDIQESLDQDADNEDGFAASPQAILLSTMSTDPAKSQRDSAVLLPSLKFLWETYRAILDILRSNSKLEFVYHAAAQNALQFCQTYKRRMEFRHLCDMLRLHLGNLRQYGGGSGDDGEKTSNRVRGWEGWSPDSIELHLQTRFCQLETASVLHRYTEGFRTVEDIYNILQIGGTKPKAKLMAAYYEKLTTLFWVSENHLFHAFAWYKYYSLCAEFHRGHSPEMKQRQASAVLLAALCIPPTAQTGGAVFADDVLKQKMSRMAVLLGFHTRHPTREALLQEIKSKNLLQHVPDYLKQLYHLLEDTKDPVIMVEQTRPLLERLAKEVGSTFDQETALIDTSLARYVEPLENVLLLRLILNLSRAYHTVRLDYLQELTSGMTFAKIEKSLVQFTQTWTVRLDHRAGCLRFGTAELDPKQLTVLGQSLERVHKAMNPVDNSSRRTTAYQSIRESLDVDHQALLQRKDMIEKRKEEAEREAQDKVRRAAQKKAEEEAARKAEEERRMAREQRLREQEKQRKIQQELDNQEKKRFLVAMGRSTDGMTEEQISKIDTAALQKEHQDKINKKKEEAERKTKEAAKRLDYLVRAIRIEELPIIKKRYEEKIQKDRELYEKEIEEKVEKAKKTWEEDVKAKETLNKHSVFDYFNAYEETIMSVRRVEHDKLCQLADEEAEAEADRGKLRRARKRKEDEAMRLAEEEARKRAEAEREKEEALKRKKEQARREREQAEEERRQAELKRMEDERKKKEGKTKYVPPAMRRAGGGGGGGSSSGGPRRFGSGDAGGYPGGGRYDGGGDRRGGGGGGGWGSRGGDSRGGGDSSRGRWR